MKTLFLSLTIFLFISLNGSTYASTYYVAKTGNDSNPGSEAQPWLSIQQAANTLVAGDTVYIKAGTYNERVVPQNSGSAGSCITYTAYPGETVTIDGNGVSVPEDEGLFYIHGKSYIKVSGLRVVNSAQAGIYVDASSNNITIQGNYTNNTGSSGIGVWNSSSIIIDGNEVESSCSNGWQENITVAGTSSFEVKNNHVHNELAGYKKEGICIKDGSANGKAYGNHVHHTWAVGIYVDAWDKHTYNIDVFQNIVHDSRNDGFTVASEMGGLLEDIRIYNNVAYNNSFLGISISRNGAASAHPMRNIKVINNTLYQNGLSGWGGGIGVGNPDVQDIVFRNNICSQNLSFQIVVGTDVPAQELTIDHNLIDGFREYIDEGASEIRGSDYVEGDPKFVNSSGADFHLQGTSPAIDKGSSLDAPMNDYDGNIRPQGGGYDIGACEYGAVPPTETLSTPSTPNGPTAGNIGTSYSYSTGGSISNLGHVLEYQFDWKGDGSDLSLWGSATQSRIWTVAGSYNVRARARCATDTAIVSNWSSGLSVNISSVPCDFNSDGKTDILWRNKSTGQNIVWFMNGAALSSSSWIDTVPDTNWQIVGTGDFNGDGKTDVLWRNTSTGQNVVWLMDGVNYGSYAWLLEVADLNWEIVGTGDFNGDGKTDILWRNKGTGQNVVWFMNGATQSSYSWIDAVADTNWEIVGTGDFNGDGKTDILWRNKTTGQNVVWFMNGATQSSYSWIDTVADTNWQIVGTGDFNGDGKTDILWRDKTTGQNIVWLMNGVALSSYVELMQVTDTNWKIVGPR